MNNTKRRDVYTRQLQRMFDQKKDPAPVNLTPRQLRRIRKNERKQMD